MLFIHHIHLSYPTCGGKSRTHNNHTYWNNIMKKGSHWNAKPTFLLCRILTFHKFQSFHSLALRHWAIKMSWEITVTVHVNNCKHEQEQCSHRGHYTDKTWAYRISQNLAFGICLCTIWHHKTAKQLEGFFFKNNKEPTCSSYCKWPHLYIHLCNEVFAQMVLCCIFNTP